MIHSSDGEPRDVRATHRRKVVVLSSRGGGAHGTAASALEHYLSHSCDVRRIDVFTDAFGDLDWTRKLTGGRFGGEDIYNSLLQGGFHRLATALCDWYGAPKMVRERERLAKLLLARVEAEAPDLIVSVIPLVNRVGLDVAMALDVPYVVVPVDLDLSNYAVGLQPPYGSRFRFALPFDDDALRAFLAPATIPEACFRVTGFPVRPGFLRRHDRARVRRDFELPHDRPVITVLMGASGGGALAGYAAALSSVDRPMHLVLCAGRNEKLAHKLRETPESPNVSRTILGFTERMAEYMAASDVLLTKPGPASLCEAIYAGTPVILDCSTPLLRWERYNRDLVIDARIGAIARRPAEAARLVDDWLGDPNALTAMSAALRAHPRPNFERALLALVDELCPTKAGEAPDELEPDAAHAANRAGGR